MNQTVVKQNVISEGGVSANPVVNSLNVLLANTYGLYLKTQNYHWNVEGPQFNSLHQMFEEQYTALAAAVDEIAERLRALGAYAPGSFKAFSSDIKISEAQGHPSAQEMVAHLEKDHRILSEVAHTVIKAGESANDPVSVDLATQRMTIHQKTAWMLKSQIA